MSRLFLPLAVLLTASLAAVGFVYAIAALLPARLKAMLGSSSDEWWRIVRATLPAEW